MPQLKIGENNQPVYQDGKFVLVHDDKSETPFDPVGAFSAAAAARRERDEFKTKAESASSVLDLFGKDDAERKTAVEKLKLARALDDKKLVDAGKVDEVVAERLRTAREEWEAKEKALAGTSEQLSSQLDEILIEKAFAGSKVLDDYFPTWSLLAPVFRSRLGREGKTLVGYRDAEKKERIYSASGELAQGDELLLALLKSHPDHDKWKKGANANGSAAPGNTAAKAGTKTLTVEQFQALSAQARMDFINKEGGQIA
jgi:hypothetical protein